jgi:magnesium chelatase family protein
MPASRLGAFALLGVEARPVEVVCTATPGLASFRVAGLSSRALQPVRERVQSALSSGGYDFPEQRVVIDLLPAHVRTIPESLGLASAIAVLAASGQCDARHAQEWAVHAALTPEGQLAPVRGALAAAEAALRAGIPGLIVAPENAAEAALVDGVRVVAARAVRDAVKVLNGERPAACSSRPPAATPAPPELLALPNPQLTRALMLAAVGGHSLLLTNAAAGSGLVLAAAVASLLPALTPEQQREIVRIHSVAGIGTTLHPRRPVRAPHPRASLSGLLGGTGALAPGEASLAHHGVLVLDGLSAFPWGSLAAIRSAYEDGHVAVRRDSANARLPTRFLLIATMTSCPAGCERSCSCPPQVVAQHRAKMAPIAGCFDVHVNAAPASSPHPTRSWGMDEVRERIRGAQEQRQARRPASTTPGSADLGSRPTAADVEAGPAARALAERLADAASPDRLLRVARTLADLAGDADVTVDCVSTAREFATPAW